MKCLLLLCLLAAAGCCDRVCEEPAPFPDTAAPQPMGSGLLQKMTPPINPHDQPYPDWRRANHPDLYQKAK